MDVFLHALLVTLIVVGLPAVVIIPSSSGSRLPAAVGAVVIGIILLLLNWLIVYKGRPVIAFNATSFYHSFWLWMPELLLAILVMGALGANHDEGLPQLGTVIVTVAWVLVFAYGLLNMANGVWTAGRAQKLASEVHVTVSKVGDYPDTDANHIVIVPEQVARRSASVALSSSSDGGSLATAYKALDPVLQSVDNHAYWIVGLRPNGYKANNRVHGIVPAYVVVDAEDPGKPAVVRTTDASGKKFAMSYTKDGSFEHNLDRYVWTHGYAGALVQDWTLEVDDNWDPFWTSSVNKVTLNFKATVPDSLLTVDAQSGDIKQYAMGSFPSWVDRIYSADTVKTMLNWWGNYAQNKGYGFFGMFRSSVNRYKVHGDPTLVYTDEGYPVWQVELSSRNNDSSVAYMALFNGRDDSVRLYQIPDLALEDTVDNAVTHSSKNLQKLAPVHLSLHKIYGKLTWVAALVPSDDADSSSSAIMQGVALMPADSQLSGGDIVIDQTMSSALNDYQTLLNGSATVKPSENSDLTVVTGSVDRVSAPVNESGKTVYYFTLKGDSHVYRVGIDPMANDANLEVPFIQSGTKVSLGYRDSGTIRRDVQSYDDLSLDVGVGTGK